MRFSRRPRVRTTCVAALGLFVCLAVSTPVETDPTANASSSSLDDQWMHMRALLRQRRRGGSRISRTRVQVPASPAAPRRVVSRDQVVDGACRLFLSRGTVDMEELALSLAISRATLYRVVHSRDQLLGDVLWRLADQLLTQARRQRTRTGVDGVLEVARGFSDRLLRGQAFRIFLTSEPDTAARVLFTPAGGVHRRAVEATKQVFHDARPGGTGPWLCGDVDKLAYLYVRIFESMYYAELLQGATPDPDLVEHAARALLSRAAVRTPGHATPDLMRPGSQDDPRPFRVDSAVL